MKFRSFSSVLAASGLAFLLSYGSICCLITGFSLAVPTDWLLFCCGGCSLAACTLFRLRHGGAVTACVSALLGGYLWQRGQLISQTLQLCYEITTIFDRAYGYGYLGAPHSADSIILPLIVYSGLTALINGWCITRRRTVFPGILFSTFPLILCLVVTDTVPGAGSLFLLLLGLLLLLLTQSVRRRNDSDGTRLTWLLSSPVALVLALLFLIIPQNGYNKQAQAENLTVLLNRLPMVDISEDGELTLSFTRDVPSQVNLQSIGPNAQFSLRVMEVTAEASGTLYLRGRHYDTYTGTQWHNKTENHETFIAPYLYADGSSVYDFEPGATGELSIRTFGAHSVKYLPYHPATPCYVQNGAVKNIEGETKYSYQWCALPQDLESHVGRFADANYAYNSDIHWDTALQLPQSTLQWAVDYLEDILFSKEFENTSVCAIANEIAGLVRDSASYDLNTPRPPEACQDFAQWFLEESDTGYCVHYATATVVLLRTAGIPARYVEGYMIDAVAGKTVTVTEQDAHAWAEYYIPGIGWIPLESTSASTASDNEIISPVQPSNPDRETSGDSQSVTASSDTTGASDEKEKLPSSGANATKTPASDFSMPLHLTAVAVLLLLLQWPTRLIARTAIQNTGSYNIQAVKKWRHAKRLSRLLGQALPEPLTELALRAKFSQHTLTPADLETFDAYFATAVAELRRRPWWQQLYFQLFHAAY